MKLIALRRWCSRSWSLAAVASQLPEIQRYLKIRSM